MLLVSISVVHKHQWLTISQMTGGWLAGYFSKISWKLHIDDLEQDCSNSMGLQWSYCSLTLSHRYDHSWYSSVTFPIRLVVVRISRVNTAGILKSDNCHAEVVIMIIMNSKGLNPWCTEDLMRFCQLFWEMAWAVFLEFGLTNAVQWHYNMVSFIPYPHSRHPIAHM